MNKLADYYFRKNWLLAWPMALNAILMQAMLIIDTLLVSPLGEISIAAMGIATTIIAFVLGIQIALANGSQLIISRDYGANHSNALHQSAIYGLAINLAVAIMLIGLLQLSDRRHLLPSAALLRTVRATFTAYGSSLH